MGVEEQVLIGVLLGMVAIAVGVADPPQVSNVTAMYLLGDSSVDCGLSTLYYPLLHRNFSLFPCEADADADASTLLPHFLGTLFSLSCSHFLIIILCHCFKKCHPMITVSCTSIF